MKLFVSSRSYILYFLRSLGEVHNNDERLLNKTQTNNRKINGQKDRPIMNFFKLITECNKKQK